MVLIAGDFKISRDERLRRQGAKQMRRDVIDLVLEWQSHYPKSLFKDPPPGRHGKTVDGCSARAIRMVLRGILKDLRDRDRWVRGT